jgi:hypothetical protein
MATLLDGVNDVLKKVGIIQGDSGVLTSFTDSARQAWIDSAIMAWRETVDELYDLSDIPTPLQLAEDSITLATADRSYVLAADLVQLRWPLIDKTNTEYIYEMHAMGNRSGYEMLLLRDPEQDDTGLPRFGAINPANGELHLDQDPTAAENGRVYTYQYDAELALDAAADVLPFSDTVRNFLVPAVAEIWKREEHRAFDAELWSKRVAQAAGKLPQTPRSHSWNPRRMSSS